MPTPSDPLYPSNFVSQEQSKTCSKCKLLQPVSAFFRQEGRMLGVGSICKTCIRIRNAQKRGDSVGVKKRRDPPIEGVRLCSKCKRMLPCENFREDTRMLDGYSSQCKECKYAYVVAWKERNLYELSSRAMKVDTEALRVCTSCSITKPMSEFYKNPTSLEGHHTQCKKCSDIQKSEWNSNNRERINEQRRNDPRTKFHHKVWQAKNPNYMSANGKEWRAMNPEHVRKRHIEKRFRNYGATPEWYDEQLALQGGTCGICGGDDPKSIHNTFHVDHYHGCCEKSCHACDNCRRGLLCSPCNTRLGILENIEWAEKAYAYLERYKLLRT